MKKLLVPVLLLLASSFLNPASISKLSVFSQNLTEEITSADKVNKTIAWTTFESDNFSIKHPPEFIVIRETSIQGLDYPDASTIRFENRDLQGQVQPITIRITAATNNFGLNLNNGLGKGPAISYVEDFLEGKTIQRLTVDGEEAVMVEDISAGLGGTVSDLIMFKDGKIFQINLTPVTEEGLTVLRQMLSTFQFNH